MLYIIIILIMMTLITTFNIIFNPIYPFYVYIIACIAFTISVIIVDAIVATIIRHMDEKHFDYHKKIFNASKEKLAFYKAIGVKKWKDHTLELGFLNGFRKNRVQQPNDIQYINKFIVECNRGYLTHLICVFIVVPLIFIAPSKYQLNVVLPIIVANAIINYMSVMILRFNVYKLYRINESNKKRISVSKQV